jgi:cytochrome c oxidase assembly factor CtaG
MNTRYLIDGWTWDRTVVFAAGALALGYLALGGRRGHRRLFAAALALLVLSLTSPLELLARGVLFSAHMAQHIVLLLLVPALLILSLPRNDEPAAPRQSSAATPPLGRTVLGWALGVGAMWFWHVPQLCDAAALRPGVHVFQTLTLLAMGTAFWWPILAPRAEQRLGPGYGIAYLFSACLACTGLGILLTLSSFEACPAFLSPRAAPAVWTELRQRLGAQRDQQVGGLLMWLPMCLIYVAGIVYELTRWFGEPTRPLESHMVRP